MKKEIIQKVAQNLNLPEDLVLNTYKAYWIFIKNTIQELPLKEDLLEKDFNNLRVNFNIPSLGKLNCTYERYRALKKRYKNFIELQDVYHKENQTII